LTLDLVATDSNGDVREEDLAAQIEADSGLAADAEWSLPTIGVGGRRNDPRRHARKLAK